MRRGKQMWLTIGLFNLCIVALLGLLLRTKMLFTLPLLEFSNVLEGHYHFAMNGWITYTLMVLMIYELLPESLQSHRKYQYVLSAMLFTSYTLLASFLIAGYTAVTMTFVTLYIFVAFYFSIIFARDLKKSGASLPVRILGTGAVIALVLSCLGPETLLGYVIAGHSMNVLVFRDTAYTYLHFQYNGFFPMAIFSLLFRYIERQSMTPSIYRNMMRIAVLLPAGVIPTLFLSYLWHYPNIFVRAVAIFGCCLLYVFVYFVYTLIRAGRTNLKQIEPVARILGILSLTALTIKVILQTLTVVPYIGIVVFGNRPIIIGYIHLVMLGFVTLYLLSHLVRESILPGKERMTQLALTIFVSGVIANELLLMIQGIYQIMMKFYFVFLWLLWGVMFFLVAGAFLILASRIRTLKRQQ